MKLLIWVCILCVAFAKRKRFHVIDEKFFSSTDEGYKDQRQPLNPSLNIPYPIRNNDFSSPEKSHHNYPENPNSDTGAPPNSWILNNPGASFYNIPNIPIPTWSAPRPTLPGASAVVPFSNIPAGLYDTSSVSAPVDSHGGVPLDVKFTTVKHPEDKFIQEAAADPGELEPTTATPAKEGSDAAKPAAREPQISTPFDEVNK
ncbi:proline-rich protein 27 [Talpa occidentalis]|uniref:proline-rich protein 27 n=1 Tax=Talpa occidentalis TaxID=50954 RepID=UPI00188F0F6D|nr:proline-rich protein 27 [Talpa occidentalis]